MNTVPPAAGGLVPEALADIQGLVTSGFGHLPCSAYLFLRVAEPAAGRNWLGGLLPDLTTSAPWPHRADGSVRKPAETRCLALAAGGLRALGLTDGVLETFPLEFVEGADSPERSRILGDVGPSEPALWEVGGRANPVDAILILNAVDRSSLERLTEREVARWETAGAGPVVGREVGQVATHGREHFGFRDGIARVELQRVHGQGIQDGEFVLGYANEYGYLPASPVVPAAEDPFGKLPESPNPHRRGFRDLGRHGTYLVYRKLEQDVAGFWGFMASESRRLKGSADPDFMIWLASKMVGRWPSGAPITLAPDRDEPGLGARDDFGYAGRDASGLGCPLGSHIRRTHPRDHLRPADPVESLHMTARHRLLRRGKPYGPTLFDPACLEGATERAASVLVGLKDDGQRRGLHFLCLNASIRSQFEFVQQSWANHSQFSGLTENRDPLIGSVDADRLGDAMEIPRSSLNLRTAPLPGFVTVRGAGYFFLPGLRALGFLATLGRGAGGS